VKRIAVIGGGIAGLSAAYRLEQKRAEGVDYALFEASGRLGGVIRTEKENGFIIEAGPDSFLSEKRWAAQLCRDLGIGADLLPSSDHQRKTFILVGNRLIEMPDGLMFMVPTKLWPLATTALFSFGAKLRAAEERWTKPRDSSEDESVASFVRRHFGHEMVERVAAPLLAGVYGGSAEKLSVRAVLPRFVTMEREHGSLIRAMLIARQKMAANAKPGAAPTLFTTLRGGMQQMTDAVAAKLTAASVHLNVPVRSLRRAAGQWTLATDAGEQTFDGVILALPAYASAELLRATDAKLADELGSIAYNSSITVALAYDAAALDAATRAKIEGFGFLVAQGSAARRKMLACTYVQNKFAGRAPEGKLLFRCFIGGDNATASMQLSDEELSTAIRSELKEILGLAAEPLFTRVFRWKQAMAQYEVGHLEKITRIDQLAAQLPGLALAGNAYRGIGVPDCVREGTAAADRILALPAK
jgi:oxygen-dependent protoporphyrinogen oxidase